MTLKALIATDGSPAAEHAIETALKVARLEGAQVWVVAATDPEARIGGNEDADDDVARAKALLASAGVTPTCEVVRGKPAHVILAKAKEIQPDLIVMGASGRGGLGRLVMGSVSGEVIEKWHGAVLAVRMPH